MIEAPRGLSGDKCAVCPTPRGNQSHGGGKLLPPASVEEQCRVESGVESGVESEGKEQEDGTKKAEVNACEKWRKKVFKIVPMV